jgi:hypothetical protein
VGDAVAHWTQQLIQRSERKLSLRFDASGMEHTPPSRTVRRVRKNGALANTWVAMQDEHAALARTSLCEKAVDASALGLPPYQHRGIVLRARKKTRDFPGAVGRD